MIEGTQRIRRLWEESISKKFVEEITTKHPKIKTIVCHWSESKGKQKKGSEYHTIYGDGYVSELTPNNVFFFTGPDTFCEVNHHVDNAIFEQSVIWFKGIYNFTENKESQTRDLIVVGRDANTFTWGLMKTNYFSKVHSITTCPCAFRDWFMNRDHLGYNESNSSCHLSTSRDNTGWFLEKLEKE